MEAKSVPRLPRDEEQSQCAYSLACCNSPFEIPLPVLTTVLSTRIWSGLEATSIQSEMVEEGKTELQHSGEGETFSYATALA